MLILGLKKGIEQFHLALLRIYFLNSGLEICACIFLYIYETKELYTRNIFYWELFRFQKDQGPVVYSPLYLSGFQSNNCSQS